MPYYRNVEYIANESGVAQKVRCPLVDDWISDIDCLENQSIRESSIPARYKTKPDWKDICEKCPFRDY